jgi:hypothetical protein
VARVLVEAPGRESWSWSELQEKSPCTGV